MPECLSLSLSPVSSASLGPPPIHIPSLFSLYSSLHHSQCHFKTQCLIISANRGKSVILTTAREKAWYTSLSPVSCGAYIKVYI